MSTIHESLPSSSTSVMVYMIPPTARVYAYSARSESWMTRRLGTDG